MTTCVAMWTCMERFNYHYKWHGNFYVHELLVKCICRWKPVEIWVCVSRWAYGCMRIYALLFVAPLSRSLFLFQVTLSLARIFVSLECFIFTRWRWYVNSSPKHTELNWEFMKFMPSKRFFHSKILDFFRVIFSGFFPFKVLALSLPFVTMFEIRFWARLLFTTWMWHDDYERSSNDIALRESSSTPI